MTEERNGISPEDDPTVRNTKSSFAKVSRHFRPKFRGNSLLVTHHLNYFKPIDVPKETLLKNGLLKETIVVNPLTGLVEVTDIVAFSKFDNKIKYTKDYRIWTMNDSAKERLKKFTGVNIGNRFYSNEIGANYLSKQDLNNHPKIEILNEYHIDNYTINEDDIVIAYNSPLSIKDKYIHQLESVNITEEYVFMIINPRDDYSRLNYNKETLSNFKDSDKQIIANRDIRQGYVYRDNYNHPGYRLKDNLLVDKLNNKIKFSNILSTRDNSIYSDSDGGLSLITIKYTFRPNTNDLVALYEELQTESAFNNPLSLEIYKDDLLSHDLYDPEKADKLRSGRQLNKPLTETKYGICIGDDNADIKPITLMSFIPPIVPIPDPIFNLRLIAAGGINNFNIFRENNKLTRKERREHRAIYHSELGNPDSFQSRDISQIIPNDYNLENSFQDSINYSKELTGDRNPLTGELSSYEYLTNNQLISPTDELYTSTTSRFHDGSISENIKSSDLYFDGYGILRYSYKMLTHSIRYDTEILDKNALINHVISGKGIYDRPNLINDFYFNQYFNGNLDNEVYGELLYGFVGIGWLKNNLYVIDGLNLNKNKYEHISYTLLTKFVKDYYNIKKSEANINLDDNKDILSKIKLSDGNFINSEKADNFDEKLPENKVVYWTTPLNYIEGTNGYFFSTNEGEIADYMDEGFLSYQPLIPFLSKDDLSGDEIPLSKFSSVDNILKELKGDITYSSSIIPNIDYNREYKYVNTTDSYRNSVNENNLLPFTGFTTYRFNHLIYGNAEPVDLSKIFKDHTRSNIISNEEINKHNFVFNLPLGSQNYISKKMLYDEVPIDRRDRLSKDLVDFPFNRQIPKLLNTYDAVDYRWLDDYLAGTYLDEVDSVSTDNDRNIEIFKHHIGTEYGYGVHGRFYSFYHNFHHSRYGEVSKLNYISEYDRSSDLIGDYNLNYIYSDIGMPNIYKFDFLYNKRLKSISDRFSFLSHLSVEKITEDDRYDVDDKKEVMKKILEHPVSLYVLGGYETLYNNDHEYKMMISVRNRDYLYKGVFSTIDKYNEHIYQGGNSGFNPLDNGREPRYYQSVKKHSKILSLSAPHSIQTATAMAIATGIGSYFYKPSPACNLAENVYYYNDHRYGSGYTGTVNGIFTYLPSLSSYLTGIAPMYQTGNLKSIMFDYNKFKDFGNKGLDYTINRLSSVKAITNVVDYNPTNYHQFITDESYHEVSRCLTAFLLADWCNIKIHKTNGSLNEFKRINNYMVRYDINGDDITHHGTPIVEDIGTKGSSMLNIINNVWNSRVEDVYDNNVIDIRKMHGGMGFSIMGITHRHKLIHHIDSIGTLFSFMNFCTPCLPFGNRTFEAMYQTGEPGKVRYDYVEDINYNSDNPIYNKTCFQHYAPSNITEYEQRKKDLNDSETFDAYRKDIVFLKQLRKLAVENTHLYKNDRVYKKNLYSLWLEKSNNDIDNTEDKDPWNKMNDIDHIELEFHFNPMLNVPNNRISFRAEYNDINRDAISKLNDYTRTGNVNS